MFLILLEELADLKESLLKIIAGIYALNSSIFSDYLGAFNNFSALKKN
jgi:hypothetical protein